MDVDVDGDPFDGAELNGAQGGGPNGAAGDHNGHGPASGEADLLPLIASDRAIPGEGYERIAQVGEGTYGQVFKAKGERTGALVALKKIRMEAEKDGFPITAMREIKILQALYHPNIVRLLEMIVTKGSYYMVFEYMEHDLNGVLSQPSIDFTPAHLKSLAQQLLSGLEYLHRKSVLHRDLKGSNLLLNNAGQLKVADFGLARLYMKRRKGNYTNRVVTLWYRSPELLLGATQYGAEVDMWGAGCIFVELFTRTPVFQGNDELHQFQVISDLLGPPTKKRWPDVDALPWFELVRPSAGIHFNLASGGDDDAVKQSEERERWSALFRTNFERFLGTSEACKLGQALLEFDPKRRASAAEALSMPYFTSEEPAPEVPAGLLSSVEGEWHEFESRKARKNNRRAQVLPAQQPGPDIASGDASTLPHDAAASANKAASAFVREGVVGTGSVPGSVAQMADGSTTATPMGMHAQKAYPVHPAATAGPGPDQVHEMVLSPGSAALEPL
ncbi:hypothetical protein V8E36_003763 [Tilletia maclaganii]